MVPMGPGRVVLCNGLDVVGAALIHKGSSVGVHPTEGGGVAVREVVGFHGRTEAAVSVEGRTGGTKRLRDWSVKPVHLVRP